MFRNLFGSSTPEDAAENGAELVERFVERVETCSAPEDRIDALRALRSLAKKYRLAVGTMGLNAFIDILDTERLNNNILTLALDTLTAVLSVEDDNETDSDDLGERLAELMLKKPTFISSVLSVIEHFDFGVRRTAIQLLTSLLRHRGPEIQAAVMKHPMGVTKLIDVIHDNREVVRNEAILMLCELSRSNGQVQQVLAYDNLFTMLFDIIELEPLDSIVIEDCLFVMLNLLRKNHMNQQLFRENNLINRLGNTLQTFVYGVEGEEDLAIDANEWPKQRTANVIFFLQIIRSLVSPENNSTNVHASQKAIYQTKVLEDLCKILLSEVGASIEILTEAIIVVAESIRGNYTNQEYFATTCLSTEDQGERSALLLLLISMTTEKQPFKLRCAVFYCFISYLYDNEFGKTKLIETLLPQGLSDKTMTPGALLCQAITSAESVQVWFGCVTLMHCLYQVDHLSEQLLRVQLTTSPTDPSVSLFDHCIQLLLSMGNRRPQMRAGLLMLLGVWMKSSPVATEKFIQQEDALMYLTTNIVDEYGEGTESELNTIRGLIAFLLLVALSNCGPEHRQKVETLIQRRVGNDVVLSALEGLTRTEHFVRAAQKPQPMVKVSGELVLDYYFIKLFKTVEISLVKQLKPNGDFNGVNNNSDSIIQSFKELIKRQDDEISVLKQDNKRLTQELDGLKNNNDSSRLEEENKKLLAQVEELHLAKQQVEYYSSQFAEAQRISQQWFSEAERYKEWSSRWQAYQVSQLPNPQPVIVGQLEQQVAELEQQLRYGYEAFEQQSQKVIGCETEIESLKTQLQKSQEELTRLRTTQELAQTAAADERKENNEKVEEEKLQEDLLVLLAEQHNKITKYRSVLKSNGHDVTDDEDE